MFWVSFCLTDVTIINYAIHGTNWYRCCQIICNTAKKNRSSTYIQFPFCLSKFFFMSWTLSFTLVIPVPLKNRGLTKVKAQALQAALNPAFCVWIRTEEI